jgi:hypothetical protein
MDFLDDLDGNLYGFNFDFLVMFGFIQIMCKLTDLMLEF